MPKFLMSLLVFISSSLIYAEESNEVLCPSADTYNIDTAHLLLKVPESMDIQSLIEIANSLIESEDPDVHDMEVRQSMLYAYKNLPVLTQFTGDYKTFQYPERQLEFVVLRPVKDCVVDGINFEERNFLYSRSFSKEDTNIAIVRQLLEKGIQLIPLTKRGEFWICSIQSHHDFCLQ